MPAYNTIHTHNSTTSTPVYTTTHTMQNNALIAVNYLGYQINEQINHTVKVYNVYIQLTMKRSH